MSTAGQRLVALSGLPSGSAAAHLLAITTSGGTGATILASRFTLRVEQPQVVAVRRAKHSFVAKDRENPTRATSVKPAVRLPIGEPMDETFVFIPKAAVRVFHRNEAMYVTTRKSPSVVTKQFFRSIIKEG